MATCAPPQYQFNTHEQKNDLLLLRKHKTYILYKVRPPCNNSTVETDNDL